QTINLAGAHCRQGRPQQALEMLAEVEEAEASDFGLMAAQSIRACAHRLLGNRAAHRAALDYLLDHADDGYVPLRSALLMADELDLLAEVVIGRLDDPVTRLDMLIDLQIYLQPAHRTAIEAEEAARFEAFRMRPDIQAAVDRY